MPVRDFTRLVEPMVRQQCSQPHGFSSADYDTRSQVRFGELHHELPAAAAGNHRPVPSDRNDSGNVPFPILQHFRRSAVLSAKPDPAGKVNRYARVDPFRTRLDRGAYSAGGRPAAQFKRATNRLRNFY